MIALLIGCAVICSLSFGQAMLFGKRIEKMLAPSVAEIITLLYLSGFTGNLWIGMYSVFVVAAAALGYGIYAAVRKRSGLENVPLHTVLLFLILIALAYIMNSGRVLFWWDEFSHWGTAVKVMYSTNKFANEPGCGLIYTDYPPGISLFQYFLARLSPTFDEGLLITAKDIFLIVFPFSAISSLPRERKFGFRRGVKLFAAAALAILTAYALITGFYDYAFYVIFVDSLLGVVFAYILYRYFTEDDKSGIFYAADLSFAFIVLCLIKDSGIGMSALALMIILADKLCLYISSYKSGSPRRALLAKDGILIDTGVRELLPFCCGAAAKLLWNARVSHLGYTDYFNTGKISIIDFFKILNDTLHGSLEYQPLTIKNFCAAFLGVNGTTLKLGFIAWLIVFAAAAYIIYLLAGKKDKARYITLACTSSAAFLLYSFYLLLLYVFTFIPSEAQAIIDINRYEYSMLLGIFGAFVLIIANIVFRRGDSRLVRCLALACAVALIVPTSPTLNLDNDYSYEISHRAEYDYIEQWVGTLEEGEQIYVVSQNRTGFDSMLIRYLFLPENHVSRLPNNPGPAVDNGINAAARWEIDAAELLEYLRSDNDKYVLLNSIDETFIDTYGELFDTVPEEHRLYRLEGDTLTLVEPNGSASVSH